MGKNRRDKDRRKGEIVMIGKGGGNSSDTGREMGKNRDDKGREKEASCWGSRSPRGAGSAAPAASRLRAVEPRGRGRPGGAVGSGIVT